MRKKLLWCLCSLLVVLVFPVVAGACLIQYSVTVTAGSDIAVFSGAGETDTYGDFEFVLVPLDSYQVIGNSDAAIEALILRGNSDPEVGVEFGLRAGGSETTFSVLSDVITFSSIVNPTAAASAGITLTDRVTGTGATITGFFDGGKKVHQARYNGSTVFANLVSGFSVPSGTLTKEEAKPLSGSETISGTLSSIESEFRFKLSARDSASGTSTFMVIPEPATIAILSLGGLLLRRKRS